MPIGRNDAQGWERNMDIVLCIDAARRMAPILDKVKTHALTVCNWCLEELTLHNPKCMDQVRVKVIAFRDCGADAEPMVESRFFDLYEEAKALHAFLDGIEASGGDGPGNALGALALAMKSDWVQTGDYWHAIFLFTNAPALPLSARAGLPGYPADMPKDIDELREMWEKQMDASAKRLLLFAPDCAPWPDMSCWNHAFHIPCSAEMAYAQNDLADGFQMFSPFFLEYERETAADIQRVAARVDADKARRAARPRRQEIKICAAAMNPTNRCTCHTDIVLCIDATRRMAPILDEVKTNAVILCQKFVEETEAQECRADQTPARSIQQLRIKIIAFRDYGADAEPMVESRFFVLDEETEAFHAFLDGIEPHGGGDGPGNALEALALAMKSDWVRTGDIRRHVILLFTNAPALPLSACAGLPGYPADMPKDLGELREMWEGRVMEKRAKRLLLFAPDCAPWPDMDEWDRMFRVEFSTILRGSEEERAEETSMLAHLLWGAG